MKILKIFLVLISLTIFLNADDDDDHKYKNLKYLKLDSTQIKQMKDILIEFKSEYHDFYEYKEDSRDKLKDIMQSNSFDKGKYEKILEDINRRSYALEAEKMEKIHKILNPKQRKKFAKYLQEWEID